MNNGGGDGTSCFKIKIRTDAAKMTNVRITIFRQCIDLVRESEMFIKDKAKIACRVSGIKRSVCILLSCCLLPMRRNSVLEAVSYTHLTLPTILRV